MTTINRIIKKNYAFKLITSISGIPAARYGFKWWSDSLRQSVNSGSDLWHCLMYSAVIKNTNKWNNFCLNIYFFYDFSLEFFGFLLNKKLNY